MFYSVHLARHPCIVDSREYLKPPGFQQARKQAQEQACCIHIEHEPLSQLTGNHLTVSENLSSNLPLPSWSVRLRTNLEQVL